MGFVITKAEEGLLNIGDGMLVITSVHVKDCCEDVYADFTQLKDKVGQELPHAQIEKVPGFGFRIGNEFVPCYNYQSGYYSSDLSLEITMCGVTMVLDISDCVEDHID